MNFSNISNESVVGRLLRLPLRLIPRGSVVRVLQGPLRGAKWIAGSASHGCWLGSYESGKQSLFDSALREGDVVFDLGANVGFYSLLASRRVGKSGQVFSFEPVPRNLAFLRKHVDLNGARNIKVLELAVSDAAGTADFGLGPNASMGSIGAKGGQTVTVETVSLDDLIESGNLPAPDVIKCDIEGGEFAALLGLRRTLGRSSPVLFLATHGRKVHSECCAFLDSIGYCVSSLDGLPVETTDELVARRAGPTVSLEAPHPHRRP